MTLDEMIEAIKQAGGRAIQGPDDAIYSVDPPETLFGFTYHAHCIPPFRPEHTLILGYGGGTIPALMRMIWGSQIRVTGVDTTQYPNPNAWYEYKIVKEDAWAYIKRCTSGIFKTKYDFICVDLWQGNQVPEIIFTPEFAVLIAQMCKRMICFNIRREQMYQLKKTIEEYGGFNFERGDPINGNVVLWWSRPIEK